MLLLRIILPTWAKSYFVIVQQGCQFFFEKRDLVQAGHLSEILLFSQNWKPFDSVFKLNDLPTPGPPRRRIPIFSGDACNSFASVTAAAFILQKFCASVTTSVAFEKLIWKCDSVTTGITFRENTLKKLIWIRLRKIPNSDVSSFVPQVLKCSSEPLIRLVLGCSLGLRIIQDPII